MKRLVFTPDGNTLLATNRQNNVAVWDLTTASKRTEVLGEPIGLDREGKVLLRRSEEGVMGVRLDSGEEMPLQTLDPDMFELSQRCLVTGQRFRLRLDVQDVFGTLPVRILRIEQDPRYFPSMDSWALAPDNTSLVVTLSGEVSGEDWAAGACMDLESGQRRFKFNVSRFQRVPPICFSAVHKQLLIGDNACHLSIFDLATGDCVREIYIGGFGMVTCISPVNDGLAAVNAWEPVAGMGQSPFSVQLLDLMHVEGERMQRARVQAVLSEPQSVEELEFAPDGRALASLLVDGTVHVWDLVTDSVRELAVNP